MRIDPNNVHALSAWGRLGEKLSAVDGATRAQRKPPPDHREEEDWPAASSDFSMNSRAEGPQELTNQLMGCCCERTDIRSARSQSWRVSHLLCLKGSASRALACALVEFDEQIRAIELDMIEYNTISSA